MALRPMAFTALVLAIAGCALAQEVDFLELESKAQAKGDTFDLVSGYKAVKSDKCPEDGPWECDSPPPKPEKAKMPPMPLPAHKVPRQAKCITFCRYNGTVTMTKKKSSAAGVQMLVQADQASRDVDTMFVDTSRHPSFLESESHPQVSKLDKKMSEAKPFICRTKCQFPRPPVCNPIYNFRLGSPPIRPDEKECCAQCDNLCSKKQILWQYRTCVHGCRAFCPFTKGHWSSWEV